MSLTPFPTLLLLRFFSPILRSFKGGWWLACCWPLLLAACQSKPEAAESASPPPVGHYEGSLKAGQLAENRATLDIRHPSPGHYEAELTVAGASNLNFVADTLFFANNQLRLRRPGRPGQVLSIKLEGDFWRGTLAMDEVQAEVLLVKRGSPTPSTYRIEELPQAQGTAWLFAPADTQTPGAALALLPDSATAAAAPLWADALAREGFIVLVLPVADSTAGLAQAQQLLRHTPGADTAAIGVWAAGRRATALAQELAAGDSRAAFFIAQNAPVSPASQPVFRALQQRKLPVLGLYGGSPATADAGRLRAALGGRRRSAVRSYRDVAPDLCTPGGLGRLLLPTAQNELLDWVRGQ